MPGLIKKDVLWVGDWNYPGGRQLRVRERDIRNAVEQGNRMLKDRLAVKWLWEHQPGGVPKPADVWAAELADPTKAAQWAKSVITDAVAFEVGHDHRGPTVVAAFDPARLKPEEVEQIQRAGMVSSRLDYNFRAEQNGGKYPGLCISHIAVTPTPVEMVQGPFQMSAGAVLSDETFYMSSGSFNMAKEGDAPPAGDDDINADNPAGTTDPNGEMKQLAGALQAAYGFVMPEGITNMKELILSIKAVGANGGGSMNDPNNAAPDVTAAGGPGAMGGAGALMSQVEYAKRWPARVANDRAEFKSKIEAAVSTGRIPRTVGQKLWRDFKSFEMSYNAKTTAVADVGLVSVINALEKFFEPNLFLSTGVNMSATGTGAAAAAGLEPAEKPPASLLTDPPTDQTKAEDKEGDDIVARIAAQNAPTAKL